MRARLAPPLPPTRSVGVKTILFFCLLHRPLPPGVYRQSVVVENSPKAASRSRSLSPFNKRNIFHVPPRNERPRKSDRNPSTHVVTTDGRKAARVGRREDAIIIFVVKQTHRPGHYARDRQKTRNSSTPVNPVYTHTRITLLCT